jgi:hypothetical protein
VETATQGGRPRWRRHRRGRIAPVVAFAVVILGACSSGSHPSTNPTGGAKPTAGGSSPTTTAPASTAATSPPTTAAAAQPSSGPCIVGGWTTTSYTQQVPGATFTGGAGIRVTITPTQISLDFSGMQPVAFHQGAINGQGKFTGQEAAGFTPSPTSPSTGTFMLTNQAGNVTFVSTINGRAGPAVKANGLPPGGAAGTWTCSGAATATLTVPSPPGPTTFVLQRT